MATLCRPAGGNLSSPSATSVGSSFGLRAAAFVEKKLEGKKQFERVSSSFSVARRQLLARNRRRRHKQSRQETLVSVTF